MCHTVCVHYEVVMSKKLFSQEIIRQPLCIFVRQQKDIKKEDLKPKKADAGLPDLPVIFL